MPFSLKQFARRYTPQLFKRVKRIYRGYRFRVGHGGAEYRAKKALVDRYGRQVLAGPFRGMRYGDDVAGSAYLAKLVGSYEEELAGIVEEIIQRKFDVVIDIGAAEGYYAVGLALRLPGALVYAFDKDLEAQMFCRSLADLNGVSSRVDVRGVCDHRTLDELSGPNSIIICDCEGFEGELLNPTSVHNLLYSDILVELHEFNAPGIGAEILSRFVNTHDAVLVDTCDRDPRNYPVLECVDVKDRPWAIREGRPTAMQWAYLKSRQPGKIQGS